MPITLQELNIYDPYNAYVSLFLNDRFRYNGLHDKLKELPNNFSDFLFDLKTSEFIKERIAVPLGLNEDQAQKVALIVLGLILSDLYLGNIVEITKQKTGLDETKAKTIAGLIVAELFRPILEELKKRHIEKFAKNLPKIPQQPQVQSNQNFDDRVVDLKNNM